MNGVAMLDGLVGWAILIAELPRSACAVVLTHASSSSQRRST